MSIAKGTILKDSLCKKYQNNKKLYQEFIFNNLNILDNYCVYIFQNELFPYRIKSLGGIIIKFILNFIMSVFLLFKNVK